MSNHNASPGGDVEDNYAYHNHEPIPHPEVDVDVDDHSGVGHGHAHHDAHAHAHLNHHDDHGHLHPHHAHNQLQHHEYHPHNHHNLEPHPHHPHAHHEHHGHDHDQQQQQHEPHHAHHPQQQLHAESGEYGHYAALYDYPPATATHAHGHGPQQGNHAHAHAHNPGHNPYDYFQPTPYNEVEPQPHSVVEPHNPHHHNPYPHHPMPVPVPVPVPYPPPPHQHHNPSTHNQHHNAVMHPAPSPYGHHSHPHHNHAHHYPPPSYSQPAHHGHPEQQQQQPISTSTQTQTITSQIQQPPSPSTKQQTTNTQNPSTTTTNNKKNSSNASTKKRLSANEAWDVKYNLLLEFRSVHNHVDVPQTYKENKSLGKWVGKQREQYKIYLSNLSIPSKSQRAACAMTEDRIAKLTSIGFKWVMGKGQYGRIHGIFDGSGNMTRIWEEKFKQLEVFKRVFGHVELPTLSNNSGKLDPPLVTPVIGNDGNNGILMLTEEDIKGLARWIRHQRLKYQNVVQGKVAAGTALESRFQRLILLGVNLASGPGGTLTRSGSGSGSGSGGTGSSGSGGSSISASGSASVTSTSTSASVSKPLSKHARAAASMPTPTSISLSTPQQEEHQDATASSTIPESTSQESSSSGAQDALKIKEYRSHLWDLRYQELCQYAKTHGHANVPTNDKDHLQLSRWVGVQRDCYRTLKKRQEEKDQRPITNIHLTKKSRSFRKQTKGGGGKAGGAAAGGMVLPAAAVKPDEIKSSKSSKSNPLTEERIKLLEKIGFEFSVHNNRWEEKWKELEEYKKSKGHLRVRHSENKQLYEWITRQRNLFREYMQGRATSGNTMNSVRIGQLERLGFDWKYDFESVSERRVKRALFLAGSGDYKLRKNQKHIPKLVPANEDANANEHDDEHNVELLGNDFGADADDDAMNEPNTSLDVSVGNRDGNCEVKVNVNVNVNVNMNVNVDMNNHDHDHNHNDPGHDHDPNVDNDGDNLVGNDDEEAEAVMDHFAIEPEPYNLHDPQPHEDETSPRGHHHRDDNENAMVGNDGMDYMPHHHNEPRHKKGTKPILWQNNYDRLVAFHREHGHCRVPGRYKDQPKLGQWVKLQREDYKHYQEGKPSPMNEYRIDLLEKIGFEWSLMTLSDRRQAWTLRYEQLKEFKKQFGHCMVPQQYMPNRSLGKWVSKQREAYRLFVEWKPSSLTKEKVKLLEDIGFSFKVGRGKATRTWGTYFEDLKAFKKKYGHTNIPLCYVPDPFLGKWAYQQRFNMESRLAGRPTNMTIKKRLEILKEEGFAFYVREPERYRKRRSDFGSVRITKKIHTDASGESCSVPAIESEENQEPEENDDSASTELQEKEQNLDPVPIDEHNPDEIRDMECLENVCEAFEL